MTEVPDVPKASKGDAAHLAVKATLSAVPIVGGPAAELFAALIQPPLEKRRQEWMAAIGEALADLQSQGRADLPTLGENEEFVDTVLQASQIALRNHQAEKRDALKSAIVNTALGKSPGDALRQIFLRYVDELTEWHLRILKLFNDPQAWFQAHSTSGLDLSMGALAHVIEQAFPPLRNARSIYDQVWEDLQQRGLLTRVDLHTTMSGHGLMQSRTSNLGSRFLTFVEEPK